VRSAGTLYYTYSDHLGNVAALSNTAGAFTNGSLARYDPFGNYRTTPATNPATTNHGFTGHRHNNTGVYPTQNVGLIYMNARYYLPEVGRFISPDTIVPEPGNPQSFNRYSYVRNSPLNFTDPTGYRECVDSNRDGCTVILPPNEPSKPVPTTPPPHAPIQPQEWETQLLAMAAFVEMHGHSNKQAEAIIWVLLNRISGLTTVTGNAFHSNSYFPDSMIAAYILSYGQTAIAEFMVTEYGLLELDSNNEVHVIGGRTLQSVVEEAYQRLNQFYSGQLEQLLLGIVEPVIASFNSGGEDITHGAIYYGHISPEQRYVTTSRLVQQYRALDANLIHGLSYRVFEDIPSHDNPRLLIVNNFMALGSNVK